MASMTEGLFLVLEGIDGAGTTTQTARLASRLTALGHPTHTTREPTSGPIGSVIRQALTHRLVVPSAFGPRAPSWQTMALLFAADRLDHLAAEILPSVRDGVTVISDRYDLSSLTYQAASADQGSEDAVAWIRQLNAQARRPDLTIVVHVPASVASERRRARGGRVELYEDDELQTKLAEAYRDAERFVPGDRVVHVDGARAIDAVTDEILAHVTALLGKR
jgi:dTMP kinase